MAGIGRLKGWRKPAPAPPGSDLSTLERLDLIGVSLVVDRNGEDVVVPGLSLRFDGDGLEVKRMNGDPVVELPWIALRQLRPLASDQKGAPPSVQLSVRTDHRTHRFLVPNVTAEVLKASMDALASRYARGGFVTDEPKKGFRLR
jgi:hypothetical protein